MGKDFNVASRLKTFAEFREHLRKLHGRDAPYDGQIAKLEARFDRLLAGERDLRALAQRARSQSRRQSRPSSLKGRNDG
jgi:hypothetical protein